MVGPDDGWIVADDPSGTSALYHLSGGRWRWVTLPVPRAVESVAAVSATNVWVVGGAGAVMHWDGSSWSLVDAGFSVTERPMLVRASSSQVWVLSVGKLRAFNGATWTDRMPADQPHDLLIT